MFASLPVRRNVKDILEDASPVKGILEASLEFLLNSEGTREFIPIVFTSGECLGGEDLSKHCLAVPMVHHIVTLHALTKRRCRFVAGFITSLSL